MKKIQYINYHLFNQKNLKILNISNNGINKTKN